MTHAYVVADSIDDQANGNRVTTMVVRMHRFVLAEFNTHRVFSRNSASSRAIPVAKQLENFAKRPAFPVSYPAEKAGMSGGDELQGDDLNEAFGVLHDIHQYTSQRIARYLNDRPDAAHRLHKSVLNRPMEWLQWHTVIVTSTEWDNFFGLRCHPAAQPEIRIAAELMREVYMESEPRELAPGQWHAPLWEDPPDVPVEAISLEMMLKTSAARCAWVSTLKYDQEATWEDVERIYTTLTAGLADGSPIHASPFEHQCTPADPASDDDYFGVIPGNLRGWKQLRHMIERKEVPWEPRTPSSP